MERKKILIVDDEDEIRELVGGFLEEKYSVLYAANGEAALQTIRVEKPDLILTDVLMPKMSGYDLFKNLRMIKSEVGEIPVIVMSGRQSMHDYFDDWAIISFLSKPFTGDQLITTVEKALMPKMIPEAEDKPAPAPVVPKETQKTDKKLALISSEDEAVRKMLKKNLEIQGYMVKVGEDAADTIAKAWEFKPRFILIQFWHDKSAFDASFICYDLAEFEKTYKIPLGIMCTPDLKDQAEEDIEKDKIIVFDSMQELRQKINIYL